MGNLNIFLSELFCQVLRQSSCAKLTSSKCTRDNIASCAAVAPVKIRVPLFLLGSSISFSSNAKMAPRVKENFKKARHGWFRGFCVDTLPGRGDVIIRTRGHGEWCCLGQMIVRTTRGTHPQLTCPPEALISSATLFT